MMAAGSYAFTRPRPPTCEQPRGCASSGLVGGERQSDVVATKTERVIDRGELTLGRQSTRGVAHQVEFQLGVWAVDVNGGGSGAGLEGLHSKHGLECTSAAQQVAGHRLGGAQRNLVSV